MIPRLDTRQLVLVLSLAVLAIVATWLVLHYAEADSREALVLSFVGVITALAGWLRSPGSPPAQLRPPPSRVPLDDNDDTPRWPRPPGGGR